VASSYPSLKTLVALFFNFALLDAESPAIGQRKYILLVNTTLCATDTNELDPSDLRLPSGIHTVFCRLQKL